jgi:adenine deaminase
MKDFRVPAWHSQPGCACFGGIAITKIARTPHSASEEILTRQRLVSVALGQQKADLVLEGATLLNSHTLTWKENWDIVISGQRIAWVGPHGEWKGAAQKKTSARGLWAVPGFGEAHKHIESTMLSPEYEADLVLRFGTTWNIEASHEFSNVNGARNVEFWLMARSKEVRSRFSLRWAPPLRPLAGRNRAATTATARSATLSIAICGLPASTK